jgi:hypothetical protein
MLGYRFWAAERPSARGITTAPPNTREGGVGAEAAAYSVPIPMPPLRQERDRTGARFACAGRESLERLA